VEPFIRTGAAFIHIPKCAGTSVSCTLYGSLGAGHMAVRDLQLLLPRRIFKGLFVFTFVRNPWDRLYSA
jgi:hypothetical protein